MKGNVRSWKVRGTEVVVEAKGREGKRTKGVEGRDSRM